MQGTAVITGGQGGLGKALADCLQGVGYQVLAPGRSELDVASGASVDRFFAEVGPVDLLVCNAGVTSDRVLLKMSEGEWDKVMDVQLKGAFLCAKAVSRQMLKKRCGHVVFISSYSAWHPHIGQANYAAAKAGLDGLSKSLAKEWGQRGIRVNMVVPGFMNTKMTQGLSVDAREAIAEQQVLDGQHSPQQVAAFVAYLDQNLPHSSGQVFNLDSRIL